MRALTFLLLIVVGFAVAACTPESTHNLPESDRIAVDARLLGTWHAHILGNDHVAVVTRGAPGTLDVVLRSVTDAGAKRGLAPRVTHHVLRFYDIDGTRVMSEEGPSMAQPDRRVFRFATYRFAADGSVTLLYLDQHEIWKVVSSLRLPGKIRSKDPLFRDLLVTASADQLVAFMRNIRPAALYDVAFGPFVRQ